MRKTFLFNSVLAAALFIPVQIYAHGDEDHKHEEKHHHDKGPHNGVVEELSNGNHIEAVREGGKVTFFVLGKDGQGTVSLNLAEGSATIMASGKTEKAPLPAELNNASIKVADKGKVIVLLNLKIQDKSSSVKFSFE